MGNHFIRQGHLFHSFFLLQNGQYLGGASSHPNPYKKPESICAMPGQTDSGFFISDILFQGMDNPIPNCTPQRNANAVLVKNRDSNPQPNSRPVMNRRPFVLS